MVRRARGNKENYNKFKSPDIITVIKVLDWIELGIN